MKSLRFISNTFLALLASLGLVTACGDIDVSATSAQHNLSKKNDISGKLEMMGRIKFEHSSTLMSTGSLCNGGRTNM